MTPTQPSLTGTLSLYQLPNSDWQRRPYFTSADTTADRAVVFIGGLHVGLFDTPFLVPVSRALEDAKWRFVQIYWSGAYSGFGTGSISRDVEELAALVKHLRAEGVKTIILMGHSTGSQDVIRYLSSTGTLPKVEGGIMVSPASDRQFFEKHEDPDWKANLTIAQELVENGKGDALLSEEFAKAAGARMTASRMVDLVGVGGLDDYFSSDLPNTPDGSAHAHPLSTSFGMLAAPALALWAQKDHCAIIPDQRDLLRRWEVAAGGKLTWRVLDGATHSVEEEDAQHVLCIEVTAWLNKTIQ